MKLAVAGLCLLTIVSCQTNQGSGAAIGAGGGAVLGGIIGNIIGKNSKGTAIGAAIGAAIGSGTGALVGRHMDKVKQQVEQQVSNAKVEEVTDANGLKAVKVSFDSGLQFDISKATLRDAAKTDLTKFATVLKNDPTLDVAIKGYTDATGGDKINLPLSSNRASAVANYLVAQGVSQSQLKTVEGLGSQDPIVDQEVAPENRRVEVYLYASEKMVENANNGTLQ